MNPKRPHSVRSTWRVFTSEATKVLVIPSVNSDWRRLRLGENAVRFGYMAKPPQTYQSPRHHP